VATFALAAAPAHVNTNTNPTTLALGHNPATNSLLIGLAFGRATNWAMTGLSDTIGNTWNPGVSVGATNGSWYLVWAINKSDGTAADTASFPNTFGYLDLWFAEFTCPAGVGQDGSTQTDVDAANTNVTAVITPGITTNYPADLVITMIGSAFSGGNGATVNLLTPWTLGGDAGATNGTANCYGAWGYQLDVAPGTYTPNESQVSAPYASATIAFGVSGQTLRPDADLDTTGWTTAPLFSKLNDSSDSTVVTSTI
jgi:hypothetical protein